MGRKNKVGGERADGLEEEGKERKKFGGEGGDDFAEEGNGRKNVGLGEGGGG